MHPGAQSSSAPAQEGQPVRAEILRRIDSWQPTLAQTAIEHDDVTSVQRRGHGNRVTELETLIADITPRIESSKRIAIALEPL